MVCVKENRMKKMALELRRRRLEETILKGMWHSDKKIENGRRGGEPGNALEIGGSDNAVTSLSWSAIDARRGGGRRKNLVLGRGNLERDIETGVQPL